VTEYEQMRDDLTAAIQANDPQRLAGIALDLLSLARATLDRRQRDATTKRVRRHTKNPQISAESADSPQGFPTPLPKPLEIQHTITPPAREAGLKLGLLRKAAGEQWAEIEAFLHRRSSSTWEGWAGEMLKLTSGTSYNTADLAQVCRDDSALERPIGSPFGLRQFIHNAQQERMSPKDTSGKPTYKRRTGGVGQRSYDNALAALGLPPDKP